MAEIAALASLILIAIVSLFQLALILGAPWGEYAMGGAFPGRYPTRLRVAAGFQVFIYALVAVVVLSRAQVSFGGLYDLSRIAIWLVVGLFAVGAVLNLITKSKWERRIWAPVTLLLLLSTLVVALS